MVELIAALSSRLRAYVPLREFSDQDLPGKSEHMGSFSAARWRELLAMGFAYLAVGLLVRGGTLTYPVIHIDEEFYLLVGDRMLHGALPFVDVWDRKPIGLFLIYAAIRLLGGVGILQYQLVALACVAATSLVIYRMARMVATRAGAWWAGVAYQLCLSAFYCFGGQAPVFYNLLVALAGLGMLRIWTAPTDRRLFAHGLAIMLVMGLAMQVKYTVLFEGVGFGLALMARGHRAGWRRHTIALAGAGWALCALAPTAAAWAAYASLGHGTAFAQANFFSIFGRHEDFGGSLWRLTKEALGLTPVWLAIFWAPRRLQQLGLAPSSPAQREALTFLRYWTATAVFGFLLFGTWYDHYVAPLLVPLMALSAPALGRARPLGWLTTFMIGLSTMGAAAITIVNMDHHGTSEQIETLTAAIEDRLQDGCLYVNEGDPILYLLTQSCLPSKFTFPNHLNNVAEKYALGVDADAEMAAILARKPSVVLLMSEPFSKPINQTSRAILLAGMKANYELYAKLPAGNRHFELYALRQPKAKPPQVKTPVTPE